MVVIQFLVRIAIYPKQRQSMLKNLLHVLLVSLALTSAAVMVSAPAMAQAEPSINQIYEAAQSGKLDQAQTMVQQVLILHPKSAKAHYVQAELFARQGLSLKGREALTTAEQLAPGLPFAKPQAVQALRSQVASRSEPVPAPAKQSFGMDTPATATSSVSPSLLLLLGAGVVGVVVWLIRRKPAVVQPAGMPASMGNGYGANTGSVTASGAALGSGLSGPQTFGASPGGAYAQSAQLGQSGQSAYGQQPASSGMGGRVMGGLATGLAVGAGVMAAQAIGKNLMGHDEHNSNSNAGASNDGQSRSFEPLPGNADSGGQNFGLNDSAGWDDAGTGDAGGGGWDS